MVTADTIRDDQILALLNIASLSPKAFEHHYPPPIGETRGSWRLSVVTDCSAALGMSNAVSLSDEANQQINRAARARCAEILARCGLVNVMDGGDGWPPDDRTPAQVETDKRGSK